MTEFNRNQVCDDSCIKKELKKEGVEKGREKKAADIGPAIESRLATASYDRQHTCARPESTCRNDVRFLVSVSIPFSCKA